MQAAVWDTNNRLEVVDLPDPEPGPGEVVVRVEACGICGTDLHFYRGELTAREGLSPGHEFAGVVEGGEGLAPGTPVAVEPVVPCRACPECFDGDGHLCTRKGMFGLSLPGGLQQRVLVPAANVYPLPSTVAPELGSLAEPLAVCVRALHLGEVKAGARALVLGSGTIGLMSLLLLRDVCSEVAVTARYPRQRETALALGASAVFEPGSSEVRAWAKERRPDVAIETVGGHAETVSDAVRSVRSGGTVVVLGVFTGSVSVPAFRLVNDEVRIVGSVIYGRDGRRSEFGQAVDLLAKYRDDLPLFQTARFDLEDVNAAFEAAGDKPRGTVKVTVLPGG